LPNTAVVPGVINDDFGPEKWRNPLKSKETKKRRYPRQNSSKLVKTTRNPLNLLKSE